VLLLGLAQVAPGPGRALAAEAERLALLAAGERAIVTVAPVVELALEGGGRAVLADLHVPPAMAALVRPTLAPLLERAFVTLPATGQAAGQAPARRDRWDRRVLRPLAADGRPLALALVGAGVALVQPLPPVDAAALQRLLAAEAEAARAGRGLWADPDRVVVRAEAAASRAGQLALIDGVVLQASAQQRYFYLNFGPDWRTDTTARIDRPVLRAMQQAGFDPAVLEGRRVRLRGVVFEENGPMIELWTHLGIEVLP